MRDDTMPVRIRGDTNFTSFNAVADAGANDDANANLTRIIFAVANAERWW